MEAQMGNNRKLNPPKKFWFFIKKPEKLIDFSTLQKAIWNFSDKTKIT